MENESILESGPAPEVIEGIVENALKKYKIDRDRAADIVVETIQKHPKFMRLLGDGSGLKQILKSRGYEEVNRKARRQMYYELRQYNKNIDLQKTLIDSLKRLPSSSSESEYRPIIAELAQTHTSSKERLNNIDRFYRELFRFIGEPGSVVDVGCGLHPLLFPFDKEGKNVSCYAALEKDPLSIEALSAYPGISGYNALRPMRWNIKDGWKRVLDTFETREFDTAFLMKLVPVVYRIERDLMNILAETPAKTWVITGSIFSMTKYFKIERRERKIINLFIDSSGKKIAGEFSTEEEFCIVVK